MIKAVWSRTDMKVPEIRIVSNVTSKRDRIKGLKLRRFGELNFTYHGKLRLFYKLFHSVIDQIISR